MKNEIQMKIKYGKVKIKKRKYKNGKARENTKVS
jgi:hypothetical protein